MRGGAEQKPIATGQRPWRMLATVLLLSLLFGLLGMGEPFEDGLRVARNRSAPVAASGDIVVIKIDDASQREVGSWPWPRSVQAKLIDRLSEAGVNKILFDFTMGFASGENNDREFAAALARSGRVVLPVHLRSGRGSGAMHRNRPLERLAAQSKLGVISFPYNYESAVWQMPYALADGKQVYPSFPAIMAEIDGPAGELYPINYRISLDSIPKHSASDVLTGRLSADRLRGKTIIVGAASDNLGDLYLIPGRSRFGGVFIHALAAETLKRGRPVSLGWLPMLLAMVPLAMWASRQKRVGSQVATLSGGFGLTLLVPMITESYQWFVDVTPAIFLLLGVGVAIGWRRHRLRGTVNAATGLPNLSALRASADHRDRALIITRVLNYAQLAAAVATSSERALVDQIVQRLSVGSQNQTIYQGDEGIFAWLIDPGTAIGHHGEALHSLFRSPARVDQQAFDLTVTFGVEIGSGRSMTQRINSALVAADEAAAEGLKWKYHDPERMKDANWRLSLLSQLDQAIESGEVWVAFQPQLDLKTGHIRGAEALARWTHPEKGPISPQEFVSAAEAGGRIEKLTLFVLEKSVAAAAGINRDGAAFDIAVNLSARMLTMRTLPIEVRAILARHGLDPKRLTLELTETAALARDGSDLAPLLALRDLGVRLSIDDYGTGLSTLDYLKKVPASEIKIDQSFIKAMRDNRSDMVMVQSTIALAHSLGRTVVAEGVEIEEHLEMLRSLDCDVAQGFLIGRPTSQQGLLRRLKDQRKHRAA
jgi:EAL domain-containing protein (putative c-di-GMP-specific phosphodiesterase class I)/CHASE2 domain-containing sensor protein